MRNWYTSPSGVASGASRGVTPSGRSASCMRCATIMREVNGSASSSKVRVTRARPNRLSLRSWIMRWVPFSARSSGTVTLRSISSGA
jgi:hypothetical protein